MPDPNRRYGSFAQTGGGRWTAAFAHLLPARPERDLVVELRRHAVVATCLLTFCMLFGGARVVLPGVEEGEQAHRLCRNGRLLGADRRSDALGHRLRGGRGRGLRRARPRRLDAPACPPA